MDTKTIEFTVRNGLCCSCGVCRGVCPRSCIGWEKRDGMYYPSVDASLCVRCGMCSAVCPGLEMRYPQGAEPLEAVMGTVLESCNAWSRNAEMRHVSASGGVVSTLVKTLLERGIYDTAFSLRGYGCGEQLRTGPVTAAELPSSWTDCDLPKSRYLPVSHENAVEYMTANPQERIILIGTSCAVRGLRNVIGRMKLREENYLLIGLFCDKVFNYHVFDYFSQTFFDGRPLRGIHFKNKESGGWPGNMKFFLDGETRYIDKAERGRVKEYFMPERCLYCVDKLNVCADISLGDNYTKQNSSPLGSNSVLLRTERGKRAWDAAADRLAFEAMDPALLRDAQYLDGRLNNLCYAGLKQRAVRKRTGEAPELNRGIMQTEDCRQYERAWKRQLKKLNAGMEYGRRPQKLRRLLTPTRFQRKLDKAADICERGYYAIKRRLR